MTDSSGPEIPRSGNPRRTRSPQLERNPLHAFDPLEQQPPASPADPRPRTRTSWRQTVGLVAAALAGGVGLVWLAHHVTKPVREANLGITLRFEAVSLWLHPALYDLTRLPDATVIRSQDAFKRYAEERGIERAWYIITMRAIQADGESTVTSTIRRPYEMDPAFYSEFPDVVDTAAGRPTRYPLTDYTKARVNVVPERFLGADPRTVLDELRMLERPPGRAHAPGHDKRWGAS